MREKINKRVSDISASEILIECHIRTIIGKSQLNQ